MKQLLNAQEQHGDQQVRGVAGPPPACHPPLNQIPFPFEWRSEEVKRDGVDKESALS